MTSHARRAFLLTGAGAGLNTVLGGALSAQNVLNPQLQIGVNLAAAPIELAGDWGAMIPQSAQRVVERMRLACLDGVRLVSDRQPTRLRVDRHLSGSPAVWLHLDASTTAWVIVDIGERAWSQLAYQFGHELGHVLANSWLWHAKPAGPSQWVEEACAEAFSLRGLGRLGRAWKVNPPFSGDNAYGDALLRYRQDVLDKYGADAVQQGAKDLKAWYARHRAQIGGTGLSPFARTLALTILAELERAPANVEAIGALNRWPGRGGLPLADYFGQWAASCRELGASDALPLSLGRALLGT